MKCTGTFSTAADKFKAFLDSHTTDQVDQLISQAISEMEAEIAANSLAGETGVSVISSGQYGLSHAAQVTLAMTNAQSEGVPDLAIVAFLSVAFFYEKELDARGTTVVADWNLDSRLDFLAPFMYARKFLQL